MSKKYIVRNEEGLPFIMQFDNLASQKKLMEANKAFAFGFRDILVKYIPNDIEIVFDKLSEQINLANEYIAGRKTISLDPFYRGNYQLRISRLFGENEQRRFDSLVGSNGVSVAAQINSIPNGHYVLVEDDSVAIETIREIILGLKPGQILQEEILKNKYCQSNSLMKIISKLHKGIIIDDVCILSRNNQDAFDTVDLRDFMFGVPYSGLIVSSKTSQIMRKPYIYPFINVNSRASICKGKEKEFSKEVIDLNMKIYDRYIGAKLENTADSFKSFVSDALDMETGSMFEVCCKLKELCID